MNTVSKPLSLYQSLSCFHYNFRDQLPLDLIVTIAKYYIASIDVYDECKTEINNDLFPAKIYRQLKWMKDNGFGDYKVGGSNALKLASADNTWENDDVDIMVYTEMNTYEYATALGLTNHTKSWTKGIDSMDVEREEKFHDNIFQVLTFKNDDFDKKIQLVFFEKCDNHSFTNFLDKILDYPAHVLYEIDFDKDDKKIYNFFLPVKMWESILEKRIPKNLHCLKSGARIQKYIERGFVFYT
ncbi:MAG: hypothetical protein H0V82_11045 [Candidatus Protochlamydia sp.]|nr:hypothetical protein [Candidatus Protochlamydia sp.]